MVKSVYLTVPLMLGSISAAYGATIEIVSGIVGDEGMARGDTPIEIYPSLDTCNSSKILLIHIVKTLLAVNNF